MQRETKQAAFIKAGVQLDQARAQIEERRGWFRPVGCQQCDDADLIDHDQAAGIVVQRQQNHGRRVALGQLLEGDAGLGFGGHGGDGERQRECQGKEFDFHRAERSEIFPAHKGESAWNKNFQRPLRRAISSSSHWARAVTQDFICATSSAKVSLSG